MVMQDLGGSRADAPRELWQVKCDGTLVAQISGFRLTVASWNPGDKMITFRVHSLDQHILLGSGCETDARRAMAAAEHLANRLTASRRVAG